MKLGRSGLVGRILHWNIVEHSGGWNIVEHSGGWNIVEHVVEDKTVEPSGE